MAWQLIYTSAPRSLEAGRSGFGTVARHRAISPLLVSAIERASQFSRLPGVDANRVIFSYLIINIAGGRFHVLSSIRDAGADYTGRTNHIAHHLVAESREIAQIGAAGPSPADVLLGMRWATAWTEHPRYFEAVDEIPLAGFQSMVNGSAWEHASEMPARGGCWPRARGAGAATSSGPWISICAQSSANRCGSFRNGCGESRLPLRCNQAMNPADFRWIGIERDSPAVRKRRAFGRPVYNLAEPSGPPGSHSPPNRPRSLPSACTLPPSVSSIQSVPLSTVPRTGPAAWLAASGEATAQTQRGPSVGFRPPLKRDRRGLWISVGVVVSAVLLSLLYFKVLAPWYEDLQARKEQRHAIEGIVDSAGYFTGARAIPNLDVELRTLGLADLQRLHILADLTERMLETMRTADFPKMKTAAQEFATFRRENPVSGLDILPKFNAVADKLQNAIQFEADLSRMTVGVEGYDAFEQLQQKTSSVESALGDYIPDGVRIKSKLDQLGREKLAVALFVLLKGSSRPAQGVAWFESALEKIKPAPEETETKKIVETINRLIADWKYVDAQPSSKATTELEVRLKQNAQFWPHLAFAG